jgi:putative transposase
VKLSQTNLKISTQKKNIQQVRIVPQANCYVIEIIYEHTIKPEKLDKKSIAGIDIGLNNLMAVSSNQAGFRPFLINGRPLKSINQYFNKKRADLQSKLPKDQKTSKQTQKLTFKRNCKISDYLHKASRQLINELVKHKIGKLIIGKNDHWKQEINIGSRNNQNFVTIPHAKLIEMISYKAQLVGMEVVLTEESYTSKCSFLDNEKIGKSEKYWGKRIKRGLFRTAKGKLINADINGSLNIIKKVAPNAFSKGVEAVVVQPYRYFSIK